MAHACEEITFRLIGDEQTLIGLPQFDGAQSDLLGIYAMRGERRRAGRGSMKPIRASSEFLTTGTKRVRDRQGRAGSS